jgi:carboxyl-terminal processing protease
LERGAEPLSSAVAENERRKDFYALLDGMVGELRDSHTRVYSPLQREQQLKFPANERGNSIRKVEEKSVVVSVAPDSEAARAGVKAGMIVRRIDGQAIDEALAKAREEIGASSSERALEVRAFSKILAGEPETTLTLELIDSGGKSLNVSLRRQTLASNPTVSARLLNSGIAYLRFSGFVETLENEIKETLEKFKDAPAMILDLRDNGGGDGEMGLRFTGNFFEREITIANLVTRTGKPPIPEMPMILQTGGKNAQVYSRPLAVLINEGTASTSELIAAVMQEQNRATIFGTRSCGCVLGFLDYKKLKSGGFLTMSEFGFVTAKKRTLEGSGVTPDKIVPLTINDIARGRDAAIEQAVRFLKNLHQSVK